MRIIIVLACVVGWIDGRPPPRIARELWRNLGGATTVDSALSESLGPHTAIKILRAVEQARFLFTEAADCTDSSLRTLPTDSSIQAMCRHVFDEHLVYAKLGNERLAEYIERGSRTGGRLDSSAQLSYYTPFAYISALCGLNFRRMPLFQVILRSKVVDKMVTTGTHPRNTRIATLTDVLNYSLPELYLHTTKSLISLFDQLEAVNEVDLLGPLARRTAGRLAGLSVAHAIPMGQSLTQKIWSIMTTDSFKQGINDIVPDLPTFESQLYPLLVGDELASASFDTLVESLLLDISATSVFFAEYLRGDDELGKEPLRVKSFLREVTRLRSLPVGGLQVMAPGITIKVVPLEERTPSFDTTTRTMRLPAYTKAEELFESMDQYFGL